MAFKSLAVMGDIGLRDRYHRTREPDVVILFIGALAYVTVVVGTWLAGRKIQAPAFEFASSLRPPLPSIGVASAFKTVSLAWTASPVKTLLEGQDLSRSATLFSPFCFFLGSEAKPLLPTCFGARVMLSRKYVIGVIAFRGIQPASADWGTDLSATVKAALPRLVAAVLDDLDAKPDRESAQ